LVYDDVLDKKNVKKDTKENDCINDVLKRKYGTREDINILFIDMLREMNIDAKLAFALDRRENILVHEAKYWQFDASLVAIPENERSFRFYAPGFKYTLPGNIPWFLEGTRAILGGAITNFASIPFSFPEENKFSGLYKFDISDDLELSGDLNIRHDGQYAREIRIFLEDNDSTEYENLLEERYNDLFIYSALKDFIVEDFDDINKSLKLICNVEYPELVLSGNRILFKPFDYFTDSQNPFFVQERKKSILFEHSSEKRESAQFNLPEGWAVEALPRDTIFANMAGECGVQFTNFGKILTVQSYFILNSPFWLVEHYPIVKELYQTRENFGGQIIVLKEEI
jgi:hypothetical protein